MSFGSGSSHSSSLIVGSIEAIEVLESFVDLSERLSEATSNWFQERCSFHSQERYLLPGSQEHLRQIDGMNMYSVIWSSILGVKSAFYLNS